MINNNLEKYIKIYPTLSLDFCKKIITELENAEWEQHIFYNPKEKTKVNISGEKELDTSYYEFSLKKELYQKVWESIKKYIVEDLNKSYFDGWSGFTPIRFNRYQETKLMALHCDHIQSMFDGERKGVPVLTVVGLLNDNYEGGKFLMFDEEKEIKLKMGDIMIFPSSFVFPHRVAPVTNGTRISFVSWVW